MIMYENFFGMRNTPFVRNVPAGRLYRSPQIDDAIGRLKYTAKNQKFATVMAELGCGKSTLVRMFVNELPKDRYEIYLLFQHEYSANFLFTLWKRVRKYGAYCSGLTQNVEDLLQSHTARTMLANSEFIIMLNQAPTDKYEFAKLINISNEQMNYITDVNPGCGLIKVGSALVSFKNKFPRNTNLYKLMTSKPGEAIYG